MSPDTPRCAAAVTHFRANRIRQFSNFAHFYTFGGSCDKIYFIEYRDQMKSASTFPSVITVTDGPCPTPITVFPVISQSASVITLGACFPVNMNGPLKRNLVTDT